jgi:PPOX class probable F420-dependent enzyme
MIQPFSVDNPMSTNSNVSPRSFDPAAERYVSLATYRRDGAEVLTPVWLAQVGSHFYLFSEGKSFKVKRIRANPRAKIAPCNLQGKVKGPWVEVRARIVEEKTLMENAFTALRQKYGWQMGLLNFFSRLSGKIQKRALIELQIC